jgi:hypothetical protein
LVKPALVAAALLWLAPAGARAKEGLSGAFAASYAAEAKANYDDAIGALKNGYVNLYEQNLRLGWLYFWLKTTRRQQFITTKPSTSGPTPSSPNLA